MTQALQSSKNAKQSCILNVKAEVRVVVVLEAQDLLCWLHACLLDKAWPKVMLLEAEVQSRLVPNTCTYQGPLYLTATG